MVEHTHSTHAGMIDNLVTQFQDPLDAFRELVQNSIDAGTSRVEVWTEFELTEDMTGVITLHVDDFGEGMDEAIIDGKLTRLFSSSKEGDLTKIGKFGIGFVSIFALKPHAVMVRTGRGGEYWELLFDADRTFSKTRLSYPVEGTQVTLFIEGDWDRYRQLATDIPHTLERWCAHSETEIVFTDQSPEEDVIPEPRTINRPFGVDGELGLVRAFEDGTEVAVAFADEPVYGFYNRGLTLTYTTERQRVFDAEWNEALRGVSVKIKSRYLEHTLARDSVTRDENYAKALAMLDSALETLHAELLSALAALAAKPTLTSPDLMRYVRWMGLLSQRRDADLARVTDHAVFRPLHGGAGRSAKDLEAIAEAGQWRVLVDTTPSTLSAQLVEGGTTIIWGSPSESGDLGAAVGQVLERMLALRIAGMTEDERDGLFGVARRWWRRVFSSSSKARSVRAVAHLDEVYAPVALDQEPPAAWVPLLHAAEVLLWELDYAYPKVTTAVLRDGGLDSVFVVGKPTGDYMARPPELGDPRKLTVAVLRNTPHMENVLRLWDTHPRVAAYMLAKALVLPGDSQVDDVPMVLKAMQGELT